MINPRLYLVFAIIGTILPWSFYVPFIIQNGVDIPLFLNQVFATGPSSGWAADVLWGTLVFWLWTFFDARENDVPHWWAILIAGCCVGLSLAIPLYFYFRANLRRQ